MAVDVSYRIPTDVLLNALEETRFNASAAASYLRNNGYDCDRSYVTRAIGKRAQLAKASANFRESIIDSAEDNVFQSVMNGDVKDSWGVLRTIGKDRGYVPKEERDVGLDASALLSAIMAGRSRAKGDAKHSAPEAMNEETDD